MCSKHCMPLLPPLLLCRSSNFFAFAVLILSKTVAVVLSEVFRLQLFFLSVSLNWNPSGLSPGRGRFVCDQCGIRCKKPSMLKKHLRTHSNDRPYACSHCNFRYCHPQDPPARNRNVRSPLLLAALRPKATWPSTWRANRTRRTTPPATGPAVVALRPNRAERKAQTRRAMIARWRAAVSLRSVPPRTDDARIFNNGAL